MSAYLLTVAVCVHGSGAGPARGAYVLRLGSRVRVRAFSLGTHTANRAAVLAIAEALRSPRAEALPVEVRTNNQSALAWIRSGDGRAAEVSAAIFEAKVLVSFEQTSAALGDADLVLAQGAAKPRAEATS